MASALELAVVRVFKSAGNIAGSGFLVSPQYILTCAHVVAFTTEGISSKQEEKPTQIIEIDFPVLEIGKKLKTEVAFWCPLKTDENIQDIAVLKLLNPDQLPERAEPINLILTGNESLWGHRFRALGFPEKGSNGEWATGILRGRVGKGRIQVEDIKETGLRLEKGFSGTAIWDEQLQGVVGMAVTEDGKRPEAKVAFITPTDLLLKVGDLAQVCQVNGRIQKAIAIFQNYFKSLEKEIRYAYYQSLPQNSIPLSSGKSLSEFPESPTEMIQNLENYELLDKFIGYLFLHLKDLKHSPELHSQLTQWLKFYLKDEPENFLNPLKKERAIKEQQRTEAGEKEPCLLVGIFEQSSSLVVRAWLIKDAQKYTPVQIESCHLLTDQDNFCINEKGILINKTAIYSGKSPQNLSELLQLIFAQASSLCQCNVKKIQLFLPYRLIDRERKSIDQWSIDDSVPEHLKTIWGVECEVAVRFSERLKLPENSDIYVNKSRTKWQALTGKPRKQAIDILHLSDWGSPKKLFKQINSDDVVAVRLKEVLQASKQQSIMETFYYAGIPVALWIRSEAESLMCNGELDKICQSCCWNELPKSIRNQRYEAWEKESDTHIGHLSLLWDDFNLVPPAQQLGMSKP